MVFSDAHIAIFSRGLPPPDPRAGGDPPHPPGMEGALTGGSIPVWRMDEKMRGLKRKTLPPNHPNRRHRASISRLRARRRHVLSNTVQTKAVVPLPDIGPLHTLTSTRAPLQPGCSCLPVTHGSTRLPSHTRPPTDSGRPCSTLIIRPCASWPRAHTGRIMHHASPQWMALLTTPTSQHAVNAP